MFLNTNNRKTPQRMKYNKRFSLSDENETNTTISIASNYDVESNVKEQKKIDEMESLFSEEAEITNTAYVQIEMPTTSKALLIPEKAENVQYDDLIGSELLIDLNQTLCSNVGRKDKNARNIVSLTLNNAENLFTDIDENFSRMVLKIERNIFSLNSVEKIILEWLKNTCIPRVVSLYLRRNINQSYSAIEEIKISEKNLKNIELFYLIISEFLNHNGLNFTLCALLAELSPYFNQSPYFKYLYEKIIKCDSAPECFLNISDIYRICYLHPALLDIASEDTFLDAYLTKKEPFLGTILYEYASITDKLGTLIDQLVAEKLNMEDENNYLRVKCEYYATLYSKTRLELKKVKKNLEYCEGLLKCSRSTVQSLKSKISIENKNLAAINFYENLENFDMQVWKSPVQECNMFEETAHSKDNVEGSKIFQPSFMQKSELNETPIKLGGNIMQCDSSSNQPEHYLSSIYTDSGDYRSTINEEKLDQTNIAGQSCQILTIAKPIQCQIEADTNNQINQPIILVHAKTQTKYLTFKDYTSQTQFNISDEDICIDTENTMEYINIHTENLELKRQNQLLLKQLSEIKAKVSILSEKADYEAKSKSKKFTSVDMIKLSSQPCQSEYEDDSESTSRSECRKCGELTKLNQKLDKRLTFLSDIICKQAVMKNLNESQKIPSVKRNYTGELPDADTQNIKLLIEKLKEDTAKTLSDYRNYLLIRRNLN